VLFIGEIDLDKSERILAILFGKRFPEQHLLSFVFLFVLLFREFRFRRCRLAIRQSHGIVVLVVLLVLFVCL
jgi:hypothetical protein